MVDTLHWELGVFFCGLWAILGTSRTCETARHHTSHARARTQVTSSIKT